MTRSRWTSKKPVYYSVYVVQTLTGRTRYEIEGDNAAWEEAERRVQQAAKSGKSAPMVSVKTKVKRKVEETDGHEEKGGGDKGHFKSKKAKRDKKK